MKNQNALQLNCGAKLRIAMISAAGTGNYGDELIRKLWLDFYRNVNILDVSFRPTIDQVGKSYQFLSLNDFWNSNIDFSSIDLIHFVGGGYINDEFETISAYTKVLSSLHGIPLIASGISFQPSRPENIQNFLNQNWKLMGLRDSESYISARQLLGGRASWSLDDTWKFSLKNSLVKVRSNEKRIFLNLQQQFTLSSPADYESVANQLNELILKLRKSNPNLRITVIEAHESDSMLSTYLWTKHSDITVVRGRDWLDSPLEYSRGDVVVSSRFHPRLLFSRAGLKVKYISLGNYYDLKHKNPKGAIFFQSDSRLENLFEFDSRIISFYFWRAKSVYRAKVFKLRIKGVLVSILIVKIMKFLGPDLFKK